MPVFPNDLLDWAGHRNGGVKKPFSISSGRPTGDLIETSLIIRLRRWANDLTAGRDGIPLAVFLVGGPGNGKTDAIETAVAYLDDAIEADGRLLDACKAKFDVELPPRKLVLDLAHIVDDSSFLSTRQLVVVQDASEVDLKNTGSPPESLFLDDVESLVTQGSRERPLFLCGINRGILAHAALVGHAENRTTAAMEFIDALTQAATSGPGAQSCWPLSGYEWAVGWPMDVESLVDQSLVGEDIAPVKQVIAKALDPDVWTTNCAAGDLCPFHANHASLSKTEAQEGFARTLHFYELASSKRWNFRDLFSLLSHVLVGHESMFLVDGQPVSPCDWAGYHAEKAQGTGADAIISAWHLASRLYMHAMFPAWPRLEELINQARELERRGARLLPGLDQFIDEIASNRGWSNTDVGRLLGEDFCRTLDPANTRRELTVKDGLTIGHIEDAFTTSIRRGLDLTGEYLTKIELVLLDLLASADEACESDSVSPLLHGKVKKVQWNLRALAGRFAKRSLAGGAGICRDHAFLERYQALLDGSGDSARRLKRSFQHLLNGGQAGLSIPLSTTYGQPPHSKRGEAFIVGANQVRVRPESVNSGDARPREQLPYLRVQDIPVPVTFPLFKALSEVDEGLMTASLPGEIFALIDGTHNLLAGQLVHDKDWLEDAQVMIGESRQELIITDGAIMEGP